MTDTFTWVPLLQPQGKETFNVRKAQFGDGYYSKSANGLNPISDTWPLSFIGNSTAMYPIRDFLRAHIATSFYWTTPLGDTSLFQCDGFDFIPQGAGIYTLNATLVQAFKP